MHMELFISEYNAHDLQSDFVNMPDRQTELYYVVMDQTKTDAEVLHALISYDFGIQAVEHAMENTDSEKRYY